MKGNRVQTNAEPGRPVQRGFLASLAAVTGGRGRGHSALRLAMVSALVAAFVSQLGLQSAAASSGISAAFTGGASTATNGGLLYAKTGGALTLSVTTSNDTKCVAVTGAHTARQTSPQAKTSWSFSFTAGDGDGNRSVIAAASPGFNSNNCTGQSQTPQTAGYVLDNTGPTVAPSLAPTPNLAGWNKANVDITWSAADGVGSGVLNGPTPATDTVNTNTPTAGVTRTATASDRLGNTGSGSVTVKLDKGAPTITPTTDPAANGFGWNNTDVAVGFGCTDSLSGVKSCPGGTTLSSNGANQTVAGTATDVADNTAGATATVSIDKLAPTLSGAPAGSPTGGWYRGDVTINWACSDQPGLSGINGSCPGAGTISGEGTGKTASASVSDKAGNTTNAVSSPPVSIDNTPPSTSATAPSSWNNVDVNVSLLASDALSGVAATHYILGGGSIQTGTSVPISTEGTHTLEYWSVDNAGNAETHKTVNVKIDKTPPSINHSVSPAAVNGWNNTAVTVTFECSDGGSGISSCTAPQTVTTEGKDQSVTGTAVDNAGNSATDPAKVSVDLTKPTISATRDRDANGAQWYNGDVTVSFGCDDSLSGISGCSQPVTLGEGANQTATGSATDAAGNSDTASASGINVDKTPPVITGAATTAPNGDGWYTGDVTIRWTCSDQTGLSGIAGSCPADSVIIGEGDNLSASASAFDVAGNVASKTVAGIKIDRHAPNTSASVHDALASGWYAGAVPVTLTGVDDLSKVATTYYSVDGGPAQTYAGTFDFSTKGIHTITFWSVDKAGNVEDKTAGGHTITLKIDGIAPTITGSRSPAANLFGWNNSDVTVHFECSDAESGIAGCTSDTPVSNEGAGQSVTGDALDNAGNDSHATVGDINIDKTPPTLSGAPTTAANGVGWYRGDVSIQWTGQDGGSGIDPATAPANSTISGEGTNLGAGPVTVADKAGNPSLPASVSGIKIDRKGPTITPVRPPTNGAGWYSGDVVVGFTCTDPALADATAGSGVAACPSDKLISGNGANQSVTGDAASDNAGNTTAGVNVGGINIDGLAPQSSANNVCTSKNGYCKGATATVKITAADQAGLSGVKEIRYSVSGGPEKFATGASVDVQVPLNGSGLANVSYWAVDNADNAEPANGIALKYDNIAPTVTHTLNPSPNADEWNNSDVTVHFDAKDDDTGSGVDTATVTKDQVITAETAGLLVSGEASDLAGNVGTDTVTVKLDRTPPTVSAAITAGTLGSNGWYTGPVTVTFSCSDALSKVAVCPDPITLTANGADQSANGTARDFAGNQAAAGVSGIKIDAEKPAITLHGVSNGGSYTLGAVPAATCTATDSFSGVQSCSVSVTGGLANGVGTFNYVATAKDNAGNVQTATGTYKVVYRSFEGFLQPINDTAHQVGQDVSVFKAGSTIPAKFQLKKADGTVVQAGSAPLWLTPAKGSLTTAAIDESLYGDAATTGNSYRWDATAQQYIYNWSTKGQASSYFYRIGVKLDDGNQYTVNIGLR